MHAPENDQEGWIPPARRAWARPPARSRRFTIMMICGILVGLLAGLGFLVVQLVGTTERPQALQEAETFVRFICLGEAGDPSDGDSPDALCGYARAYDMLSKETRARLSYGAFCEEFDVVCERSGSIQRLEKQAFRRARRRREGHYSYLLYFGHEDVELDDLTGYLLEMWIGWQDSRWVVTRFSIQLASHREMR